MKYIVFLFFFFVISNTTFSEITLEWVSRYNGPQNESDVAFDMALDNAGNIYITGESRGSGFNFDFATVKYNPSGVQQWAQRFNEGDADIPVGIAVDAAGNVYVTGYSTGFGTEADFITIKYNSDGIQQWYKRYNGFINGEDVARAIALDNFGNIYIAGMSEGIDTQSDYVIIKYNSSGTQLWIQRYNGKDNNIDYPVTIVIDSDNYVYVTGSSFNNESLSDFATLKYNSSGNLQWINIYNTEENSSDYPSDLAVDQSGNVIITGTSNGNNIFYDNATVKLNSAGVLQWSGSYSLSAQSYDGTIGLVVDSSDNIYVTGGSAENIFEMNYTTIKYNSSGVQQWINIYNGPGDGIDRPNSIAIDALQNIYITGESDSNQYSDFLTIKYNTSGVQEWTQRYNGQENYLDGGTKVLVDKTGNVFVTGFSSNDFATIKYSVSTGISQNIETNLKGFSLFQNYPNPFNPGTVISYSLIENGLVTLKVFDALGKEVATLVNEVQNRGNYNYQFSTVNYQLPSGIYFYKLEAGDFVETKRMILLK